MKRWNPCLSAVVVIFAATSWAAGTVAMPYEEELEEEDDQHIVRLVRDFHVIAADGQHDPRTAQVDLAFVEQMGRPHQGAVDMAETYLDDPRRPEERSAGNECVSRFSYRWSPDHYTKIPTLTFRPQISPRRARVIVMLDGVH